MQHDYEVIRPIVLCAETVAARSRQPGLVDQRLGNLGRQAQVEPAAIAAHLLYGTPRYPPIHDRAIVRIVQRKCGYKTNHHTVKHFLARLARPVQLELPLLAFAQFADA